MTTLKIQPKKRRVINICAANKHNNYCYTYTKNVRIGTERYGKQNAVRAMEHGVIQGIDNGSQWTAQLIENCNAMRNNRAV